MKCIETQNAVGHVLCHDLTKIVKGEYKDARFRRGHVVTAEDIPVLLGMGKEHLYVLELDEATIHEDEAAAFLSDLLMKDNMRKGDVKEGKIELFATCAGTFMTDVDLLNELNAIDGIAIAARRSTTAVASGDKLAAMRVIPLAIERERLDAAKSKAQNKSVFRLLPHVIKRAGLVTTGSEVFKGMIDDTFSPVVKAKLLAYGVETVAHEICDDTPQNIVTAINRLRRTDAQLIICTGGMSVDPDDRTPYAIRLSGAGIVSYGAPVFPGAMMLVGYFDDDMPILGLPGCVMYADATLFDALLPRILSRSKIKRSDITSLGNGGLCLSCEKCCFPQCGFSR